MIIVCVLCMFAPFFIISSFILMDRVPDIFCALISIGCMMGAALLAGVIFLDIHGTCEKCMCVNKEISADN